MVYAVHYFQSESHVGLYYRLFIAAIVSISFRGVLTFFNLAPATQFLVKMTIYVIEDLVPFLIMLMGQNMIFAIIFVACDYMGEEFVESQPVYANFSTLSKAFTNVWDLMNGMANFKAVTRLGLFFYYLLTMTVNIGMLNIVISVVSETYERVYMFKSEAEFLTKSEILYEYATLVDLMSKMPLISKCFKKSSDDEYRHLYMMRMKQGLSNTEDEWSGKIKET